MQKDLGLVTAYGAALEGGYTGTFEDYKTKMLELLDYQIQESYDDTELRELIDLKADKTEIPAAYDDSQIRNLINGKVDKLSLATVATSGSYNDLSNKPTINTNSIESSLKILEAGNGEYAPFGLWFYDKPAGGYDANGNLVHSWQDLIDQGYLLLSDDLEYNYTDLGGTFKIPWKKYLKNNTVLPYTKDDIVTLVIENHEWYPYIDASLDQNIFDSWLKIKQVVFKNGIRHIPHRCFNNCGSLERIYLPDSVYYIGNYAFAGCNKLFYVRMPYHLTKLGDGVFAGVSGSNSNITNWFLGTKWPTNITVLTQSLFSKTKMPKNTKIPFGITTIQLQCFENCTNVETVSIPNTVEYIGQRAFYGCASLVSITIPESVTTIGENVFTGCTNLTTIYYKGTATGAPWGAPNATIVTT